MVKLWRIGAGAVVLAVLLSMHVCVSQPVLVWNRTLDKNPGDFVRSVVTIGGQGFLLAGRSSDPPRSEPKVFLLRIDSSGEEMWERVYDFDHDLVGVVQSGDGFILVGEGFLQPPGQEIRRYAYFLRVDKEGTKHWEKTFYGCLPFDAASSGDEGCIAVGWTGSGYANQKAYLLKVNDMGDKVWERSYGEPSAFGQRIVESGDGGFVVAIDTGGGLLLLKIDAQGDKVWERIHSNYLQDLGQVYHQARCLAQSGDGGFVVVGYAGYQNSREYVLRTDKDGYKVWEKINRNNTMRSIAPSGDGGYIAVLSKLYFGMIPSMEGDGYLAKLGGKGETLWERGYLEAPYFIVPIRDGEFMAVGSVRKDHWYPYLFRFRDESSAMISEYGLDPISSLSILVLMVVLWAVSQQLLASRDVIKGIKS
jgi:hypothetical protein